MDWMERFKEDHLKVLQLCDKLEGIVKDIKVGIATPNVMYDLKEFLEIIEKMIIPHFQKEEEKIYPEIAQKTGEEAYINEMYEDHRKLYQHFAVFQEGTKKNDLSLLTTAGAEIAELLRHHIYKEEKELPNLKDLSK